jgi:serine-type D-Ala-D-Ala endopeptidase (penicillin-binding protein 7)
LISRSRLHRSIPSVALAAMSFLVAGAAEARPTTVTPQSKSTGRVSATKTQAKPKTTTRTSARTRAARARAAAQARAAAAARALREANTPRYKKDAQGNVIPDIRAAAAIVFNPQTNEVLWEANSHDQRSIASLTKLMTGVTFIVDDPDLDRVVVVTSADVRGANVTYLRAGESLKLRDVLHLTLIASDNAAARVLARTSEGGTPAFVARMNDMARQLGLTNSHYEDPSGLDPRNVSSAYDLSHLIAFASTSTQLTSVMQKANYDVHTSRRDVSIRSTNKLLNTGMDILAGKTGFIRAAGYCFATLLQVPQGSQVAVVVLGAANSAIRFAEARHLFNWVVGRSNGLVGGGDQANDELDSWAVGRTSALAGGDELVEQ